MIDAVAVVVAFLLADPEVSAICGARIAGRDDFGRSWKSDEAGISVYANGGPVINELPIVLQTVEIRCYGTSPATSAALYNVVSDLARNRSSRRIVAVDDGPALLYYLSEQSAPTLYRDDDAKRDFMLGNFLAAAGADPVPA